MRWVRASKSSFRTLAIIALHRWARIGGVGEDGHVTETATDVNELAAFIGGGDVVVLSGAGLSTESGIPDYRGATGATQRKYAPMTYQTFVRDAVARRRYWARGFLGWRFMDNAEPNAGHLAVAQLQDAGLVHGIITQNVDGLHDKAGSTNVIDLHGRLDRIICLGCGQIYSRDEVHARLAVANAQWQATATAINPDGDVELPDEALDEFVVVNCEQCGGDLKPDVVYFGENVPRERVEASYAMVERSALVLVLGSSLHVFSGRRFVMRAAQDGKLVVIVNDGVTRCDDLATLKLDAPLGATLQAVVTELA
jgi:NAD-dependent SIR2 family protein deacetylase